MSSNISKWVDFSNAGWKKRPDPVKDPALFSRLALFFAIFFVLWYNKIWAGPRRSRPLSNPDERVWPAPGYLTTTSFISFSNTAPLSPRATNR
jgi:hypothetical protein